MVRIGKNDVPKKIKNEYFLTLESIVCFSEFSENIENPIQYRYKQMIQPVI